MRCNEARGAATVYQILIGRSTLEQSRIRTRIRDFDILPANRELAGAEVELIGLENREYRLRDALNAAGDSTISY